MCWPLEFNREGILACNPHVRSGVGAVNMLLVGPGPRMISMCYFRRVFFIFLFYLSSTYALYFILFFSPEIMTEVAPCMGSDLQGQV